MCSEFTLTSLFPNAVVRRKTNMAGYSPFDPLSCFFPTFSWLLNSVVFLKLATLHNFSKVATPCHTHTHTESFSYWNRFKELAKAAGKRSSCRRCCPVAESWWRVVHPINRFLQLPNSTATEELSSWKMQSGGGQVNTITVQLGTHTGLQNIHELLYVHIRDRSEVTVLSLLQGRFQIWIFGFKPVL